MKLVSTIALGMALTMGSVGLSAAVAKEKPAATTAPQLSKEYRAAAGPVQEAIKAGNLPDALTKLSAADAVAKSPDELFISAQFRYQIATTQKDEAAKGKAIEAMVTSGGAPATLAPQLNLAAGNAAYQAGNYPRAVQYLTEAQRLGNKTPDVFLLLAEASFKQNQVPAGLAFVQQAITAQEATGQKAPKEWYARAASVAYMETCVEDDEIALRMDAGRKALMARGVNEVGPYQSPMEDGMQHFHEWYRNNIEL